MLFNSGKFRIIYLLVFIGAIFIASWRLPAYATRMPWLLLLALSDLYLFSRLYLTIADKRKSARNILIAILWLPSLLLLVFLMSMAFLSPVDWNPMLRTYLLGVVVFVQVIKVPPLIVITLFDIRGLIFRNLRHAFYKPVFSLWLKISLAFSLLIAVIMTLGMTIWVYDFEVVEHPIPVHQLPQSFEGYRIAHISDLHLGRWHSGRHLQEVVGIVNSLEPDLIAFTGDLVNYATSEAYPFKEILSGFRAKDGVFAVLGNHDYGDYMRWPTDEIKQDNINDMFSLIQDLGWNLLENKHQSLYRSSDCLSVSGTGHYSTKSYIPDRADFKLAYSGLPDSCIHILLAHTPEVLGSQEIQSQHFDLVLSGHTHALQLGFRIGGKAYSPAALIYRHWGGLYTPGEINSDKGFLYVNRGLGHIAFPVRIGMKPEITLLILTEETNK